MASLPSDPKLLAYLQEYVLECSMCGGDFNDPRTLDCLHTFCLHCIDGYISQQQAEGRFSCPMCKCEQTVPQGGAASLDSSYIHHSVEKVSKIVQSCSKTSERTTCTCCAKNSAGTACYNCGEFLCTDCEEKHSTLKATKDHTVCPMGELLTKENLIKFQRQRFENCAKHDELKKLFCRKCDVALCNVCVYDEKHQKHDVTSIVSKVDDEIKVVEQKMVVLTKDQELHASNIAVLNERLMCMQTTQEQVIAKIEADARKMHEMIDNYKAVMTTHVTTQTANQMLHLEKTVTNQQNQLNLKAKLNKDITVLQEFPLESILPACSELLGNLRRCKTPYMITPQQLQKTSPQPHFIGRDEAMTQYAIDSCLQSIFGYVSSPADKPDRIVSVTESDMKPPVQKDAIDTCNDVITAFATSLRSESAFKAIANAIREKWRQNHNGDWKCCVSLPGLSATAGHGTKKRSIRLHVQGLEISLFKIENIK